MNDLEHKLSELKKSVTLRQDEKRAGRARLSAYLKEHPAVSVRSPFAYLFAPMRYALALLLIIGATGSGVAFAAERAEPGDTLYVVRVRVTEPARVALVQDPEKRAELEVELVDRRLKEYAQITVEEDKGENHEDTTALILDVLSDRLEDVHEDIQEIRESEAGVYAAFDAASELRATLAAHTEVLEHIGDLDEEAADAVEIAALEVEESVDVAEQVVDELESVLASITDDATAALLNEEQESSESLNEIVEDLSEDTNRFDEQESEEVDGALKQIETVVESAKKKKEAGEEKEALRLFDEASEQTTRLKTLLDADATLGVDLFGN